MSIMFPEVSLPLPPEVSVELAQAISAAVEPPKPPEENLPIKKGRERLPSPKDPLGQDRSPLGLLSPYQIIREIEHFRMLFDFRYRSRKIGVD